MEALLYTLVLGVGATLATDVWGFVRKRLLGVPAPDFALVGRWVGHMRQGRFFHAAITKAPVVRGERLLGWSVHYATGIAFAALLLLLGGESWREEPTLGLSLAVGVATVAAPFFIMHPGMGAGFAASRTPRPNVARLHSLLTHAVFGLGLYVSGLIINVFVSL